MPRERHLMTLGGQSITIMPSAVISFVLLSIVMAVVGLLLPGLTPVEAIIGGVLATAIHFAGEIWHQLGHGFAARRAGYPMVGIRLWLVLGTSIYPENEGDLPARIHIQRALGGPVFSSLLLLLAGVLVLVATTTESWLFFYLMLWAFVDNLLVFTLGAFMPIPLPGGGKTDGGTLLYWWPRRHED